MPRKTNTGQTTQASEVAVLTEPEHKTRRPRQPERRPFEMKDLVAHLVGPNPEPHASDGLYVRFQVGRQWWQRHLKSGLTVWEADRLAIAAGMHPSEIWNSWWDWADIDAVLTPANDDPPKRKRVGRPESVTTQVVS